MAKCSFGEGVVIKPDGINELDPCIYQDIEKYKNVTVTVSKCMYCGEIHISWEMQPDTQELDVEDF